MTSPSPDYYAVLQIPHGASQQEIARAYRAQLRRHHPDVANGDAVPAELQLAMQAFAVLRDPKRRAAYDREVLAAAAREPAGTQPSASKPQNIPVRVVRHREPPLRVTPVRWESGPWT